MNTINNIHRKTMTSIHSSLSGSQSHSRSGSSSSVHSVANTVMSTTPLTAAYRPPQKDYAAAFAALQAQYGTSGDFPARAVVAPKKKKQRKTASNAELRGASSSAHAPAISTPLRTPRNLEARSSPALPAPSERSAPAPESSPGSRANGEAPVVVEEAGDEKGLKPESGAVSKLKRIFRVRGKGNR
ncbi:hypothetical protein C8R44DRAFT_982430 [Mycena epipterygia]|nr:hypothetical protein C8R44DRAFT_982430 [Mycena epipterygia]